MWRRRTAISEKSLAISVLNVGVVRAALTTRRYAAGPPTVFGIDEVEVRLTGRFNGMMASRSGTAEQAPGMVFEATLSSAKTSRLSQIGSAQR
jgi:hypothetical protein